VASFFSVSKGFLSFEHRSDGVLAETELLSPLVSLVSSRDRQLRVRLAVAISEPDIHRWATSIGARGAGWIRPGIAPRELQRSTTPAGRAKTSPIFQNQPEVNAPFTSTTMSVARKV
jgi:hypothetical protein